MAIDATSEFDEVQTSFSSKADPVLTLLKDIADTAAGLATEGAGPDITFLSDITIAGETGLTNVTDPPDPVTPADPAIFALAIEYLDWLKAQTLIGATFPDYEEIIGTPPADPAVSTDDPTLYTLSDIPDPTYIIPVWDDASAWSGGDVSLDGTVGPLVKPFNWTGGTYTSKLIVSGLNVLYEKIKADLQSNNYGLDSLDDGRIYERARERESNQMNTAVDGVLRLFSTGGFEMPTGAAQAALSRVNIESRDRISSINREILSTKAALFLEAKKVAQANGLQLETLEQGFYNADQDRLLRRIAQEITSTVEVAAYNVQRILMHVQKYSAFATVFGEQVKAALGTVEIFKAQIEAENTKAIANKTLVDIFVAKNKDLVDTYLAQLKGFESVVDGRVRYHSVLADVYKSQVSQVNAYTDATKGAYELVDKQHKTLVDFELGKYNGKIAASKTKLDEVLGVVNTKVDQMKARIQAAATTAAAAMSALNVNLGLSLGASTSISGSETYSHDETKSTESRSRQEIHSYDETKSTSPGTTRQEITYDGGTTNENTNYNYQGEI